MGPTDNPVDDQAADLPVRRAAEGPGVSTAEMERVFRRAAELQLRAGSADTEGALPEGEVIRIGSEVGLDRRYLKQALAEVRADSLVPGRPRESSTAVRLYGTAFVRASRVVPGDRGVVDATLALYMRDQELLKPVRQRPGQSLWEPAGGLVSTMRRAMDIGGRGYELAKARSIEIAVEQLEPGWSLVTLAADLTNQRKEAAAGWYLGLLGLAIPVTIALVAPGGLELPLLLGAGLTGGTAAGTATWATAAQLRKRRGRMELALHGLLDRLEQGEGLGAIEEDEKSKAAGPEWMETFREKFLE